MTCDCGADVEARRTHLGYLLWIAPHDCAVYCAGVNIDPLGDGGGCRRRCEGRCVMHGGPPCRTEEQRAQARERVRELAQRRKVARHRRAMAEYHARLDARMKQQLVARWMLECGGAEAFDEFTHSSSVRR